MNYEGLVVSSPHRNCQFIASVEQVNYDERFIFNNSGQFVRNLARFRLELDAQASSTTSPVCPLFVVESIFSFIYRFLFLKTFQITLN